MDKLFFNKEILKDKVAIIFGASGAIAGAVAHSMGKQGAKVYLTGKRLEEVQGLADNIIENGGSAEAIKVDALIENEIENAFRKIVFETGKIDIVFNGIGINPKQHEYGVRATEISYNNFLLPITTIVGSQFLTSRIAAKYMIETNSKGTILTLSSSLSRSKTPFMAGITSASSAIEGLTLSLAAELGMNGIKVICLNSTGLVATRTIKETYAQLAKIKGTPVDGYIQVGSVEKWTELEQVADVASYLVSDEGSIFDGCVIDVDFIEKEVVFRKRRFFY